MKLAEPTIAGTRAGYEDTIPIPTIGAQAEVSYGNFLFSTRFGGFYVNTGGLAAIGGLRRSVRNNEGSGTFFRRTCQD